MATKKTNNKTTETAKKSTTSNWKKFKKFVVDNLSWTIPVGVAILCAIFLIVGQPAEDGSITLDGSKAVITESTIEWIEQAQKDLQATITYSDTDVDAKIVTENGEQTVKLPTVESVDGVENPEDEKLSEEDGKGAWHDTSSYLAYYNSVGIGNCINNAYGAQCFALASDFWTNYSGRALNSCGTGAAKGTLNCWQTNAGDEFVMVWDKTQIQPGDWVVFTSGTWGHIGMAMGYYNNGYVSLYGQNQGGGYCAGGGAATNVINISLKDFGGAFRPKTYIHTDPDPEPTPDPTPTPSTEPVAGTKTTYTYVKGDYFSKVLVNLRYDEGNLWGSNGSVQYYTGQLIDQDMLDTYGNVKIGVPFTLTKR